MKLLASSLMMGFGLMSFVSAAIYTFSMWGLRPSRPLESEFDWVRFAGLMANLGCCVLSLVVFIVGTVLFSKAWRAMPDRVPSPDQRGEISN
jgi:hypothetical protein